MIKIQYDKSGDSAYIYLKEIEPAGAAKTYPCDPKEVNGMINLDFDQQGLLIGIEVIDASKKLPQALLDESEKIGN